MRYWSVTRMSKLSDYKMLETRNFNTNPRGRPLLVERLIVWNQGFVRTDYRVDQV